MHIHTCDKFCNSDPQYNNFPKHGPGSDEKKFENPALNLSSSDRLIEITMNHEYDEDEFLLIIAFPLYIIRHL